MSDEQERDAATIVAEWRAELDTHDREAQDGDRTWHFTHYIRADPEAFIRAALRELDRLTAERDNFRQLLTQAAEELERHDLRDKRNFHWPEGVPTGTTNFVARIRAALGIESEADHE